MYDQNHLPPARHLARKGEWVNDQFAGFFGDVFLLNGQFFGIDYRNKVVWLGFHQ